MECTDSAFVQNASLQPYTHFRQWNEISLVNLPKNGLFLLLLLVFCFFFLLFMFNYYFCYQSASKQASKCPPPRYVPGSSHTHQVRSSHLLIFRKNIFVVVVCCWAVELLNNRCQLKLSQFRTPVAHPRQPKLRPMNDGLVPLASPENDGTEIFSKIITLTYGWLAGQ